MVHNTSRYTFSSRHLTLDAGVLCLSKLQCMREIRWRGIAIPVLKADDTAVKTIHLLCWTRSANTDQHDNNNQNVSIRQFLLRNVEIHQKCVETNLQGRNVNIRISVIWISVRAKLIFFTSILGGCWCDIKLFQWDINSSLCQSCKNSVLFAALTDCRRADEITSSPCYSADCAQWIYQSVLLETAA